MSQYRQGDLLIEKVESLPSGVESKSRNPILAYGEVTGHCHQLNTTAFDRWEHDGLIYVRPQVDSALTHDEHGEIPLKAGDIYRVTRQRQFDPMLSIPKPVID